MAAIAHAFAAGADITEMATARMRPANAANLVEALRFLDGMQSGGGTVMGDAVQAALGDDVAAGRSRYVLFLTDGFVGNVALKTSEGVAKLVRHFIGQEFRRSLLTRLAALVAGPVLKAFARRIDPRRYNGASLLGLNGIVIKSHGGADRLAYGNAIRIAAIEVEKNVPALIKHHLGALHAGGDAT